MADQHRLDRWCLRNRAPNELEGDAPVVYMVLKGTTLNGLVKLTSRTLGPLSMRFTPGTWPMRSILESPVVVCLLKKYWRKEMTFEFCFLS